MYKRVKTKSGKLLKFLLVSAIVMTTVFQSIAPIFAITTNLDRNTAMSSYLEEIEHIDNLGCHHDGGGKRVFKINGKYAYCIESDVGIRDPYVYQDGNNAEDVLKKGRRNVLTEWFDKYNMISALLTMIPSAITNDNKTEHIHWLVGQVMIWEITGEERDWNFTYVGPTYTGATAYRNTLIWDYASDEAEFNRFYSEVEAKMLDYWKLPSFTVGSPTYDITSYSNGVYSRTLTDTNNVLANFDFSASGYTFTKNGNQLTVSTTSQNTATSTINVKANKDTHPMRSPVFWTSPDAGQKTVTCGELEDPQPFAYFKVKLGVGSLQIAKQDNKGNYIPNTQFKVSYHADMSSPIGTYTTGADGKVPVSNLAPQTVYIQEVSVPDHLILDSTVRSVNIISGQTTSYNATNLLKSNLTITKKDNKGNFIANAQFKISYNADMSNPIGTYTTVTNGTVTINKLLPQTIYIQEVSVPTHLVLDSTVRSVHLVSGDTGYYTATNNWKQGRIRVTKKDQNTGKIVKKAGAKFNIYDLNKNIIDTITTDTSGKATSKLLDYGTYYVGEVNAPTKYLLKVEVSNNVGVIEDGKTYDVEIANIQVRGSLNLSKVDSINGQTPLGEATLENAVYGLYARHDILDPADDSVIYRTGTLVDRLTTDVNGKASVSNLYLGDYYVKELTPSYGYNLDTTEYDFSLTYANQNTSVVTKNQTVLERVISQAFSIIKISSDQGGQAQLLQGAEFTIKAQKDIDAYGSWEGAPIATNANGQIASIMVTDTQGYAVSDRLPIGTYVVRETKTPDNKYQVDDFTVVVTDDSSTPQPYRVFNDTTFQSVLKIVKKDAETGKTVCVKGATFKIKNLDTGDYFGYWNWNILNGFYTDSWTTSDLGMVMTGNVLKPGYYQLEEIASPKGYLLSDQPVAFTIASNVAYETLQDGITPVITVEFSDTSVKGQINVEKKGEVLVRYENGNFVYETRSLAGMKVNIYAKEDIMDPSNDGTVIYRAGTLVDTITTGTNGKATSKKLPLGIYEVKEIEAPKGMVLNTVKQTVELKYKDQNTPIVYENVSFVNERQKVELDINKLDLDENIPLEGSQFTMYANKDIENADGVVIVHEGDAVTVATSDENGHIAFNIDLPIDLDSQTTPVNPNEIDGGYTVNTDANGNILIGDVHSMFRIQETKRPSGYATLHAIMYLDTTYQGQNKEKIEISYDLYNEMTRVVFTKTDITTGKPVYGAMLQIIPLDENGNPILGEVFDSWITLIDNPLTNEDESIHLVKGLEPGRYILRETLGQASLLGYVTAEDVEFEVLDTGEIQRVEMKDDYTKVEFDKVDIATGEPVVGAELSVIPVKENGELDLGAVFETWLTDGTTHHIKYLPIGKYVLREKLHGQAWEYGYVTAEDVKFTVEDTGVLQKVEMKDDFTKVEISKVNKSNHNIFVEGAQLSLIPVKEDGTLDLGATFDTWITDNQVHHLERIPVGKYVVREVLGNASQLGYVTADDLEIEVKDTPELQSFVMEDDYTHAEFTKVDTQGQDVAGATLSIVPLDENGNMLMSEVFDTWVTQNDDPSTHDIDESIHLVEYLPIGQYKLVELSAPDGYVKALPVSFEVKDTAGVQRFEMIEKQVLLTKTDVTGDKQISGAEMTVKDENGNVVDEWISTEEAHAISGLEEGKTYTLTEELAPHGFVVAESIQFTVNTEKENQNIVMKDKQISISKVDGDGQFVEGAKLQIVDAKTKDIVDQWVSGKETHNTNGLIEGHHYILQEIKPPRGYALADDIEFTVSTEKENQQILMKDIALVPSVSTSATINDEKSITIDNNVDFDKELTLVDTVTYTGLDIGYEYTVSGTLMDKVTEKPFIINGKPLTSNVKFIPTTYDGTIEVEFKFKASDMISLHDIVVYEKIIDDNGKIVTKHEDINDMSQTILFTKSDTVAISKLDATNHEELPGAHLELRDEETNSLIEQWISTEEQHYVNVIVGKKYKLIETIAPKNYKISQSIIFEVDDNGNIVQKVEMIDELLPVKKVETGDDTSITVYLFTGYLAIMTIALFRRKKHENE